MLLAGVRPPAAGILRKATFYYNRAVPLPLTGSAAYAASEFDWKRGLSRTEREREGKYELSRQLFQKGQLVAIQRIILNITQSSGNHASPPSNPQIQQSFGGRGEAPR